ncbi:MAG: hypothetical protein HOV68_25370 [Streptomycetaceae bacterium]|nr:hypothetical protein [Streptomycetaceae bacterium]
MTARQPEEILRDIVQKQGRGAVVRRKMTLNKEANWLLALTLHTFAKVADGAKLTDLETTIAKAFRDNGFGDDDMRRHAELERAMPAQMRNEIFPRRFAQLDAKQGYSMKDLERDAAEIVRGVLARPNVTKVDVPAIHAGQAHLGDFPLAPRATAREHGAAMLVATEPNAGVSDARYTIKATSFRCVNRATDSIFDPSNEPYWLFGSLGSGISVTTRSQIFEGVDSGESRTFPANQGCIWGQNCAPQALPDGEVGALVSLFEHDEGDVTEVKAGFAAAFAAAAVILTASGVAAWVGAVVAGVGTMLQWLLTLMNDDHIADQTFVFTRDVVAKQVPAVGATQGMTRRFDDGDGVYDLNLLITHVS